MSTKTFCDGCGVEITNAPHRRANQGERAIRGERTSNVGGWELPSALPKWKFDWCLDCATVAFEAVETKARERTTTMGADDLVLALSRLSQSRDASVKLEEDTLVVTCGDCRAHDHFTCETEGTGNQGGACGCDHRRVADDTWKCSDEEDK